MSSKLKIYTTIAARIAALVTEVKTVRLWNNQTPNEEDERAYECPAVFVEFQSIQWETMNKIAGTGTLRGGSNQQRGVMIVTIHCQFVDFNNETTAFSNIDAILQKIYYALQGYQTGNATDGYFTALERITERQATDHNQVLDWQVDFQATIYEQGEKILGTTIPSDTIDQQITYDLDIDNQTIRTGDGDF